MFLVRALARCLLKLLTPKLGGIASGGETNRALVPPFFEGAITAQSFNVIFIRVFKSLVVISGTSAGSAKTASE